MNERLKWTPWVAVPGQGAYYRLRNGILEYRTMLANGEMAGSDEGGEVDFDSIEENEALSCNKVSELLAEGKIKEARGCKW